MSEQSNPHQSSSSGPASSGASPTPPTSPFRPDVLAGQSILVTGGGSGLGKGVAKHFAEHGATVHIWGRRESVLKEAAQEIEESAQAGGTVHFQAVDVRDPEAVDAALVAGPPCFDRMLAARPLRESYRQRLGAGPHQLLVVLSSTWGEDALLARNPELVTRLARRLPLDEYR